jgi:hypothetical protein
VAAHATIMLLLPLLLLLQLPDHLLQVARLPAP